MFKLVKWGIIGGTVLIGGGMLFLGRDLFSYASSSGRMLKTAVKEAIPVQFEIQRARDLLDNVVPEMHANLRLVAQEEVEVASLEKEVTHDRDVVTGERAQIQKLRGNLEIHPASLASATGAGNDRQRDLVEALSQRFERFRTSELLLQGKEKLLQNRRKSLQAAIQRLEKTRLARVELAAQIEALEGQFRLLQAQGSANELRIDDSRLAQTQRLLTDLKKRLEVAQRVLEREARWSETAPVAAVSAESLADEIDQHFHQAETPAETVTATSR